MKFIFIKAFFRSIIYYYKELSPEIEIDIVEYIKDCSTEQQQRLSHDNHKNHKLLDASIKHKKTLLRNQD